MTNQREAQLFADLRALAQERSCEAMKRLGELATGAESESVTLGAIKELLDRAWGRTTRSADETEESHSGVDFRWIGRPDRARWDPSRQ
jgi:hypothetical protein